MTIELEPKQQRPVEANQSENRSLDEAPPHAGFTSKGAIPRVADQEAEKPAQSASDRAFGASAGPKELGKFNGENPPGKTLGGTTQHLAPGQALDFEIAGNQIYNVVGLELDPPHGVATHTQKLVHAMTPGQLGDSNDYKHTITMSPHAKPGEQGQGDRSGRLPVAQRSELGVRVHDRLSLTNQRSVQSLSSSIF